jgi:hypothetical protein
MQIMHESNCPDNTALHPILNDFQEVVCSGICEFDAQEKALGICDCGIDGGC